MRCLEHMSTMVSLANTRLSHIKRPPGKALGRRGTTLNTTKRQQVELRISPTLDPNENPLEWENDDLTNKDGDLM